MMKKRINLILTLMSFCVVGIIGLQLFWNYQNYRSTVGTFERDINETLNTAVDLEIGQRRQLLINQAKRWLADTAFIRITCDTKNRDSNTVFHINDRYPKYAGSTGLTFGLAHFKPKLNRMIPEAKTIVINHFADTRLRHDLEEGMIYYYTQRLGDSLKVASDNSHVRMSALDSIYRRLLLSKRIRSSFHFNPRDTMDAPYLTQSVNTFPSRSYRQELVRASFESPSRYFIKTMWGVILTTLLLVAISLLCFGYTAKTLLSQHKLTELKDDFINNMTHEINTPLASIKITTEALKTFDYKPERQKEYLDIIGYQTEKLQDLTTRILNTNQSLTTAGQNWALLNVGALLDEALHAMASRLTHQQTVVQYQSSEVPVLVYGEARSLAEVFTNLIDNALKYASTDPKLAISLVTENRWVEITFADNGLGIPAEYQAKVFDPFFRVPRGNVHDVKGYGLGLSYVNQVVSQHRGTVTVEPNQPGGSQFHIKLPLA